MGMAASQARYLALVARKSNCEYEGQQINQARLLLSNQSANLFNQMLGLKVPVPPSTQDFTKTQYSYSDGINTSTIDSWKQLSNDPEYNYVVTTHYYTDVYTGSVKKMSDPQVQVSNSQGSTSLGDWSEIQAAYNAMTAARAVQESSYNTWQTTKTNQERIINNIKREAYSNNGYKPFTTNIINQNAMANFLAYNKYQFNTNNNKSYSVKIFDPGNLDPTSVDNANTAMTTAIDDAETANANAHDPGVTLDDARAYAIEAAQNAITAAENALEIANLAVDDTAIAAATTALHAAQDALQAAQEGSDLPTVQQAAQDAYNAVENLADAITPTVISNAKTNIATANEEAQSVLQAIRNQILSGAMTIDKLNSDILNYNTDHGITNTEYVSDIDDLIASLDSAPPYSYIQQEVMRTYGLVAESDSDTGVETGNTKIVLASEALELANNVPETPEDDSITYTFAGYALGYAAGTGTTNIEYIAQIASAQALIDADYATYQAAQTIYERAANAYNALNRPTYIGNSELTLLGTLTAEQSTELLQVVKDLKAQGITSHILECFDNDDTYLGGVYSFKLNGNTYYTTFADLDDAYASNTNSNNFIDGQYKMPYYNASYISTRIEKESKALLETDGNGRFTSIRFEDDSITYTLNMETVTDSEAYNDAMNQYYYENAKYDKAVQDINAKTSMIQREDQELELRLKQLDTERNALNTEIDAVQKVIKDNVEASFKTFGG